MLRFLIIDDTRCKKNLDHFLMKNKASVKTMLLAPQIEAEIIRLGHNINSTFPVNKRLFVNTPNGTQIINISQLTYCKSGQNKTKLFFADRKSITVPGNLAVYEAHLNKFSYIRIHQSYLVNMHCIVKYTKGKSGELELNDGTVLPVAARRKDHLLKQLDSLFFNI